MNNKKSYKLKKFGVLIIAVSLLAGFLIIIYRKKSLEVLDEKVVINNEKINKGFEEIESIDITKLETVDGEPKVKWERRVEETEEIKSIIDILDKKVELLNQNYCAIVNNRLTINKIDGNAKEYGMLIGEKVITIYDGDLKYRIENKDYATKFKSLFEEQINNTINVK